MNPLQNAFANSDTPQCGFCTLGQILTAKALLSRVKKGEQIDESDIKEAMSGDLCRCGYHNKIIQAVKRPLQY